MDYSLNHKALQGIGSTFARLSSDLAQLVAKISKADREALVPPLTAAAPLARSMTPA